jgi:hypothetical protein
MKAVASLTNEPINSILRFTSDGLSAAGPAVRVTNNRGVEEPVLAKSLIRKGVRTDHLRKTANAPCP